MVSPPEARYRSMKWICRDNQRRIFQAKLRKTWLCRGSCWNMGRREGRQWEMMGEASSQKAEEFYNLHGKESEHYLKAKGFKHRNHTLVSVFVAW